MTTKTHVKYRMSVMNGQRSFFQSQFDELKTAEAFGRHCVREKNFKDEAGEYREYAPTCEPIREQVERVLADVGASLDYYYLLVAESHCNSGRVSSAGAFAVTNEPRRLIARQLYRRK